MKKQLAALAIAASMILVGCGSDSATDEAVVDETEVVVDDAESLIALAEANADLSTFVSALQASDVAITLQGDRIYTVFAPSNDAFAALPAGLLDKLLLPENRDLLVRILNYHLVQGGLLSVDVAPGEIGSSEGTTLMLDNSNGVMVNDATVITADIEASNGVIHIIDKVLLPASIDLSGL